MPRTNVILYIEADGSFPLQDWLDGLQGDAVNRCLAKLKLLEEHGHDLRRPHAEYIEGTDLYELRVKYGRINLRMLYFFHERGAAVAIHGSSKERKIPRREIDQATRRMAEFRANPERHTYRQEEIDDG